MKLALSLNSNELCSIYSPAIVENYRKCKSGRVRRSYVKEFTPVERRLIGKIAVKVYKWYLVSGYPQESLVTGTEMQLAQRASNFFGGI